MGKTSKSRKRWARILSPTTCQISLICWRRISITWSCLTSQPLSLSFQIWPSIPISTVVSMSMSMKSSSLLAASYDKMIDELSSQQGQGTFIHGGNRANDVAELSQPLWWHLLYRNFLCHWSLWSERSSSSTTSKSQKVMKTVTASVILQQVGLDEYGGQTDHQPSSADCLLPPSHLCLYPPGLWPTIWSAWFLKCSVSSIVAKSLIVTSQVSVPSFHHLPNRLLDHLSELS